MVVTNRRTQYPDGKSRNVPNVSWDDIDIATNALSNLCTDTVNTIEQTSGLPDQSSKAVSEMEKCNFLAGFHALCQVRFIVAVDHARALQKSLLPPRQSIAPWTCARTMLEQCALIHWLLDPKIELEERVKRVMRIRLHDIDNHRMYRDKTNRQMPEGIPKFDPNPNMLALERTIVELAPKLGVEQLGRPLKRLPPMNKLVDQFVAGFTFEYNLLSSVSHGRESLIIELMLDGSVDRLWASKHTIDLYHMWSLINNTINWISKATWVYFDYCGWNFEYMTRFLEKYYESVGLAQESRFVPPHVSPIPGV